MNFIHVKEKISSNVCKDILYYKVDTDRFLVEFMNVKEGYIKDHFSRMFPHFKTLDFKVILLDELNYTAKVLLTNGKSVEYRLEDSFYTLLDIIIDTLLVKKVVLSKSGWEKVCKELALTEFKSKRNKITEVLFSSELDNKTGYKLSFISEEEMKKGLGQSDGLISQIILLNTDGISDILFWRDHNVMALKLDDRKFICFNCTEKSYKELEGIFKI